MIGRVLARDGVAEREHLRLVGDVGERACVTRVPGAARAARTTAFVSLHVLARHVADRDVAALGGELLRELAAHARAAARDDGDLAREALHGGGG